MLGSPPGLNLKGGTEGVRPFAAGPPWELGHRRRRNRTRSRAPGTFTLLVPAFAV